MMVWLFREPYHQMDWGHWEKHRVDGPYMQRTHQSDEGILRSFCGSWVPHNSKLKGKSTIWSSLSLFNLLPSSRNLWKLILYQVTDIPMRLHQHWISHVRPCSDSECVWACFFLISTVRTWLKSSHRQKPPLKSTLLFQMFSCFPGAQRRLCLFFRIQFCRLLFFLVENALDSIY